MNDHDSHATIRAHRGGNYWQLLAAAADALAIGDFPAAERRYQDARDLRDTSPGRVFITEKIGDGLRRLMGSRAKRPATVKLSGRWKRSTRDFVNAFRDEGDRVVREGVRLAELRPEDDAETNQPILESALFLVARSRIFQEEPSSAVPLLRGVFRTAARTGRPFSVDLVRHDLPLTEEDRLWLARKGGELVESFVEQGHLRQGSPEAGEWAEVFLQLLQARYFGSAGRLDEERAWLEALTADRLLGRAEASVDLYRAYLAVNSGSGQRADEARVRLLELLSNANRMNFAVPRYGAALGSMQSAGLSEGSAVRGRFEEALAKLEYRRPAARQTADQAPAWASVAVEADGRLAIVFWWDNEPRDLAFWSPGEETAALAEFLAPCAGRLVAADQATLTVCRQEWDPAPAPWTAPEFVTALMESRLPAEGLAPGALLRLALAETGPWRAGWRGILGHSLLEPPHSSSLVDSWQQGRAAGALQAGLMFLAVRSRVAEADLSLRAGIGEMARRGDRAAGFLYGFLVLDSAAERALDATFAPWTLPLLWTRPDPLGWQGGGGQPGPVLAPEELGLRPDLGRSDLTIVTTGNAAAVLGAWGEGKQKWRIVVDRLERMESLNQLAGNVTGPVTLIPRSGQVHCLAAALQLLEDLLVTSDQGADGLLPIFHWTRLVESHNGDLLDFRQARPRPGASVPLYQRYAHLVADLPTEDPSLSTAGNLDSEVLATWGGQFSQRVRKAGLVAGTADQLGLDERRLDSLWGVFEGSAASWVFTDSAAIHWTLHRRADVDIQALHRLLHSRGDRHLSVLSSAIWQGTELEELLAGWLRAFGSAYCLSLTDTRAPALRLADRGIRPGARLATAIELAGQMAWVRRAFTDEGPGTVRLPARGRPAEFWRQVRSGQLALGGKDWSYLESDAMAGPTDSSAKSLVVPVLSSLEREELPVADEMTRAAWVAADEARAADLTARRQLCALEIAMLLAGPWRSVDILDTRWWRLVWPLAAAQAEPSAPWHGAGANALATGGLARTFDLPVDSREVGAIDSRALEVVRGWLAENDSSAAITFDVPAAPQPPFRGRRLIIGDLGGEWAALATYLAYQWECGSLRDWVLLVADRVPPEAAEVVARSYVAGCSVWLPGRALDFAAPVLWVAPEDFGDSGLRQLVKARPPLAVVADDLADWLPNRADDAQAAALALRVILDSGAGSIILRASELGSGWGPFLGEVCGAEMITAASPAPALTERAGSGSNRGTLFPDCGQADRPAALAHRLRVLLRRLRSVLDQVGDEDPEANAPSAPDQQLVPLDWLGRLSGMTSAEVAEGILLLRWAAKLLGDPLATAGAMIDSGGTGGHTLLIGSRFADLERRFDRLAENLSLLVPMWLAGSSVPGLWHQIDLEHPPARIDPRELSAVDAFLCAVAGGASYGTGLVYHSPRGLLNSPVRFVGTADGAASVLPALLAQLAVFRSRVRDILGGAVETGSGFRVETGLQELRDDEREFMGLGVVLGLWRWLGPPCGGALFLVDLLSLAESTTVRQSPLGWQLFEDRTRHNFPVAVADLPVVGRSTAGGKRRPRLGQLRRLLSAGVEASDDLDDVVSRVSDTTRAAGDPALLVLKGMLGSGRHEALIRGLMRSYHLAEDPGDVVFYCPDEAVATMLARTCCRFGYARPLDIRIPAAEPGVPVGPQGVPGLADPGAAVVVMCEVQRFDTETRYRVAQMGRGRLLVMTVDPAASADAWEHLFLTTPRANEIVQLTEQRELSQAIWSEVRALDPAGATGSGRSRRAERGRLESGYATNLVQSVARIVATRDEGVLPGVMRLTTPLAADLEYLGGQLRERGWLAVDESRLDRLLLPGPREILAAATDCLYVAGLLKLELTEAAVPDASEPEDAAAVASEPAAADGPEASHAFSDETGEQGLLMPMFLGREGRPQWRHWFGNATGGVDMSLADFVAGLVGLPWSNTFLRHRGARRRCEELLSRWGGQPLRSLADEPMWRVWWYTVTDDMGWTGAVKRRPVVLLTDGSRAPGSRVAGGIYLCVGTEPARRHYEFLGRVSDGALVLYQERSPLPGESPA